MMGPVAVGLFISHFWGVVGREVTLLARRTSYSVAMGTLVLCLGVCLAGASAQTSGTPAPLKKSSSAKTAHSSGSAHSTSAAKRKTAKSSIARSSSAGARHATSSRSSRHSLKRTKAKRIRGQEKIDSERARSIQEALIREHYLSGEPSGVWNQESEDAMRRYQGDHGWQTKEVPDSRALIKLGLGPSKDHLLNPDSAMTTTPDTLQTDPPRSAPQAPTSHSATPDSPAPTPVQSGSSPQ
jgi:hypothetical protein